MDISLNSETVQYNVEYECQYKNKKSECDDDLEEMYQQDIIHIFGLDDFNYEKMIIEIEKIYNLLVKYDVTELLECSKILAARYMTQDPVIGLIFLFSYKVLSKHIAKCWTDLTYCCIGNTISLDEEFVRKTNGITISPKKNFSIIKIWMSDCSKQNPQSVVQIPNLNNFGSFFKKHPPGS